MKKKLYEKPSMEVFKLRQETALLAGTHLLAAATRSVDQARALTKWNQLIRMNR